MENAIKPSKRALANLESESPADLEDKMSHLPSYDPKTCPDGLIDLSGATNMLVGDLMGKHMGKFVQGYTVENGLPILQLGHNSTCVDVNQLSLALLYGPVNGPKELSQAVAQFINRRFAPATAVQAGDTLTTNGVPALVDMISFNFCEPGEAVMVLTSTYLVFPHDLCARTGVQMIPVSTDSIPDQYSPKSRDNDSVDFQRIQQAWQAVVRRHSLLRAVFVCRSPEEGGSYQIVLKDPVPSISLFQQELKHSATSKQLTGASFSDSGLQHHLSVHQTDATRAHLRFQFNHALADGHSFDTLVRDFQLAYDNRLEAHCPPYSRFLQYVMTQSHEHEQSRHHWANYMDGIEPCFLPASTQPAIDSRGTFSIDVPGLDAEKITKSCAERQVSLANILQVAWALVLRRWTGSRAPCFGNIVSARDVPVDGVDEMMGPLSYLMPSQVQLDDDCVILNVLKNAHEEFIQTSKHQAYSMTQLWRHLGARGSDKMFNTALSIARHTSVPQETCDGHIFEVRETLSTQ
ncbi:uncharacterized protein Triagg1_5408 [Trichoderma aggressivum f. europaeum]|uniref:Condensation domain-containing protein n=1 Tax=Trichoderma aggressivum f. europaeum TaxID=173218 RepID=A0AAE1IF65_9HYPO|nr:hypothetical protein Triagg1_5408 [Trichoderma aggressivum f. europaeum]